MKRGKDSRGCRPPLVWIDRVDPTYAIRRDVRLATDDDNGPIPEKIPQVKQPPPTQGQ